MPPTGKILLRISTDLHQHLIDEAKRQGVSLNQLIATLLAGASGFKRPE